MDIIIPDERIMHIGEVIINKDTITITGFEFEDVNFLEAQRLVLEWVEARIKAALQEIK